MPRIRNIATNFVRTFDGRRRAPGLAGVLAAALTGALAAALLSGCASSAPLRGISKEQLVEIARERGLDSRRIVLPFELNEEMRRWAREVAPPRLPARTRLERLRDRLLDGEKLALEYVWGHTGTAVEVFEDREANCLAFTNLFVAMAREVGLPVFFLTVEGVESYRREGDLVVVSDHVAVGYNLATQTLIYDFSIHRREEPTRVRKITDWTAVAMFYSNRGAEALQNGDVGEALGWLKTAVALDPEFGHAWSNLGVALRRSGDHQGAEEAYRRALEVDPRVHSAYQNLASLLRLAGYDREARDLEQALRRSPNKNPYTYLALGDISRRSGRLDEARRLYRRAAALSRGEAEPYAALGQLAVASGDLRLARRMLKKARRYGEDERTDVLARLLAEDGGSGS